MAHTILSRTVGTREITIETGKLAKLADGAVVVRSGDTIVLVSAVSATILKDGQSFFPLTVDYKETAAAAGKIPGSYFKREGKPSEKEILTARMTDRPLRPLFPKGYYYDTQIISLLLSADQEIDPDILSINGASAALCVSDIPFAGPVAAVRVGRVNGEFVVNPTHSEREHSDLDLVYVGNENEVVMIEGAADQLPDDIFIEALKFAHIHVQPLIELQKELAAAAGKEKREYTAKLVREELMEVAYAVASDRIEDALYRPSKVARNKAVGLLRKEVETEIKARFSDATPFEIEQAFDYLQQKTVRITMLDKGIRADGRNETALRELTAEAHVLPRPHGSALFSRGETQAVATATLAPLDEKQLIDSYGGGEDTKRFILHYNFPPFSVGETGRFGFQSRREVGHGALAERSLLPVVPSEKDFPYTIRIVSEVMESNGSTSMASVCSGCLALMDAGVPIVAPVAGISVGLVSEHATDGSISRYRMLTDILGSEDHFGDMDFKLCGTAAGVTGFQLDLKLTGVSMELMTEAVQRAKGARLVILDAMAGALAAPRSELAATAPRIETMKIDPETIGKLIGPGGKTIKGIAAETGAEINVDDDGTVRIYCGNAEGSKRAKEIITGMFKEIEIGQIYQGKVTGIKEFGCFVEVIPGKEGLVHISELAEARVKRTEDIVRMGDQIWVQCIGIDEKGRVKLSRKAAMQVRGEAS